MATIKTDRVDFEKLLNGLDPVPVPGQVQANPVAQPVQQSPTSGVVDNSAAGMMEVRMFEFDYDGVRKGLRKKARKTVLNIVKHIVPSDIIAEDYIQDKIEQDIETITALYMQVETNTVMQRSLMDSIAKGNCAPRMYEVFGQMTDKIQSINKQIVDTEQRLRKTYLDLKFETRDKQSEDIGATESVDALPGPGQVANGGVIITSTKNLIASAKQRHLESLKAKEENND